MPLNRLSVLLFALSALLLSACAPSSLRPPESALPSVLYGRAVVLEETDPAYAKADAAAAVKPQGKGGVSSALVIRTTSDIKVYRMWNGPEKVNAQGFTNRIGQWWSYDAPEGTQEQYRRRYEICESWNELNWMATCTLKSGSVVAIGPGQSVSVETCANPDKKESYPASPGFWQTWVAKAWARTEALDCPPARNDYRANPENIALPVSP